MFCFPTSLVDPTLILHSTSTDLFLVSANFDNKVCDAKVLQCLPVSNVLELGISNVQTQHAGMCLKNLTSNLQEERQ